MIWAGYFLFCLLFVLLLIGKLIMDKINKPKVETPQPKLKKRGDKWGVLSYTRYQEFTVVPVNVYGKKIYVEVETADSTMPPYWHPVATEQEYDSEEFEYIIDESKFND